MSGVSKVKRKCHCGKVFEARTADVKRGWAKSCSKSCAARKSNRETGKYEKHLRKPQDDDWDVGHPFASGFFGHGQD